MKNLSIEQLESVPWISKYIESGPPEPAANEIKTFIQKEFIKRDSRYSLFYAWLEIINLANDSSTKLKILDACCGRGQISHILQLYGHRVFACDIDNCFCSDLQIDFIQADLNKTFPYEDGQFDIVINSTALHYLISTEHFLRESYRILKPGGRVIFSIPNIANIPARINFFRRGSLSEYGHNLERKNFVYPQYLFALLTNIGFKIESLKAASPSTNKCIYKLLYYLFCIYNSIFNSQFDVDLLFSADQIIKIKK